MKTPERLLEGLPSDAHRATLGRWAVMDSLRLPFTEEKLIKLARNEDKREWESGVMKAWCGIYDNRNGLNRADLEIEAECLGVFDDIYQLEEAA